MLNTTQSEADRLDAQHEIAQLREEVTVLAKHYAALQQQHLASSALVQMLGRAFGFGATGKLERAHFKLTFKQEQLAGYEALCKSGTPRTGGAPTPQTVAETAQQKMERMIAENPAELEPHIRGVYRPLIAAEQ